VHPAEGELDLTAVGKLWVCDVAIDLQDALEAGKMAEQRKRCSAATYRMTG